MAANQSGCQLTENQIEITNIALTSASFCSFIFGLLSVLLNRFCYYRYKNKHPVDPTEGIFFHGLLVFTALELVDSFQWLLQLNNAVACTVLGAIREYVMASSLVIVVSLGIHLLILLSNPRCLQVIKEVKLKRHTILKRFYIISTLLVPAFFVPWPFIGGKYGKDVYLCWITSIPKCTNFTMGSDGVFRLLLWHFWATLVLIFALFMVVVTSYRYCTHKSFSMGTKSKTNLNVCTIISLLLTFIIAVMAGALGFVWELIMGKPSLSISLQAAVLTPFMLVVYSVIITIRQVRIVRAETTEVGAPIITGESIATRGRSYGTTHTCFPLPGDEWN